MSEKSSRWWLNEHFSDNYVKKAKQSGFRSRAVFKLSELQEKYHLFKPGMTIIDLGASPGSWSQLLGKWVGQKGRVLALDILPMEPLPQVEFIQGDFTEEAVFQHLLQRLAGASVDWVVSDMAPNLSGIASVDQARSMTLVEMALDFARQVLSRGKGGFLVKVFQGEGFDAFLSEVKRSFQTVVIKKPKASRDRSREIYLLARGLKNED